jgi:hypothetical protein
MAVSLSFVMAGVIASDESENRGWEKWLRAAEMR